MGIRSVAGGRVVMLCRASRLARLNDSRVAENVRGQPYVPRVPSFVAPAITCIADGEKSVISVNMFSFVRYFFVGRHSFSERRRHLWPGQGRIQRGRGHSPPKKNLKREKL